MTSSPLIAIKSRRGSFSEAERRLADSILEHRDEVPFSSVHELADWAGVSVASVSRFVRSIGLGSFKEFKTRLAKDFTPSLAGQYQTITPQDDDDVVIEKTFAGNVRSLEETLRIVDRQVFRHAVQAIATAPRVVFFGIGSSGHIAQDAALRFSQLDMQAEAYSDSYQILNQALRLQKGAAAVGISHSGRSAMTVEALRRASEGGATTIGLSNYLHSPLHRASNLFLCTSFPESRVMVAALSSRIAQMCLIDALYMLVARHRNVSAEKVERLNAYAEKMLRTPPGRDKVRG